MMRRRGSRSPRRAFTLIELMVVVSILAVLFGLGVYFYPNLRDTQKVSNGVDQVTGALLIAKQRARRDRVPTGVRFLRDANGYVTELQYIQQPEVFSEGTCTGSDGGTPPTLSFTGVNFTNQLGGTGAEMYMVMVGDYIELAGKSPVHQIAKITSGTQLQLRSGTAPVGGDFSSYRIIRQPRPLVGEQSVKLPDGVVIDMNTRSGTAHNSGGAITLTNIAGRNVLGTDGSTTVATFYEILFAPSGAVINQADQSGQVFIWVRDSSADNSTDLMKGDPTIVAVQLRSGFIAAHPVAPASYVDPYTFTKDARSSGM